MVPENIPEAMDAQDLSAGEIARDRVATVSVECPWGGLKSCHQRKINWEN